MSLLVRPARAVHSSQCFAQAHAFKRQVRPIATRTSLRSGSCRVPATSGRLVRLVVALGTIRFACTGRQRASAGPQSRAATPPSLVPRRRTRSQLPSCSAVITSPSGSNSSRESGRRRSRCDCASACCSSAVSQACVSLVVRGVGATQQRAPPTRGGQAVAAAGHLARCQTQSGAPPTASASGTHNSSQRFVAMVLVLVRQMRTRKVGLAASTTHCHSASCRTLGTLAHYSFTRIAAHVCAVPFELLFLLEHD